MIVGSSILKLESQIEHLVTGEVFSDDRRRVNQYGESIDSTVQWYTERRDHEIIIR